MTLFFLFNLSYTNIHVMHNWSLCYDNCEIQVFKINRIIVNMFRENGTLIPTDKIEWSRREAIRVAWGLLENRSQFQFLVSWLCCICNNISQRITPINNITWPTGKNLAFLVTSSSPNDAQMSELAVVILLFSELRSAYHIGVLKNWLSRGPSCKHVWWRIIRECL